MKPITPVPGSFRDPAGRVLEIDGSIYRTVNEIATESYDFVRDSGFLKAMIDEGRVVATDESDPGLLSGYDESPSYLLRHERLSLITFPYEWTFGQLRSAALFHLDLQLEALKNYNISFSDATAFNVQFEGCRPIFIDPLSFKPYKEGEYWEGHQQFCEQFLNPLLLTSWLDLPFNGWYRGQMHGIPTDQIANLIPLKRRFSPKAWFHIILPSWFKRSSDKKSSKTVQGRGFSKSAYIYFLSQLSGWIQGLSVKMDTTWKDYAECNTYSSEESGRKEQFVRDYMSRHHPKMVVDLGCNTGRFSFASLEAGAERVLGIDADSGALERAFAEGTARNARFTPLFVPLDNPTPSQGWQLSERDCIFNRMNADVVLALALVHHLAISKNISLKSIVEFLLMLAPRGIVEFVEKADPMVQRLLAFKRDIYPDYRIEVFLEELSSQATLESVDKLTETRHLISYVKNS